MSTRTATLIALGALILGGALYHDRQKVAVLPPENPPVSHMMPEPVTPVPIDSEDTITVPESPGAGSCLSTCSRQDSTAEAYQSCLMLCKKGVPVIKTGTSKKGNLPPATQVF